MTSANTNATTNDNTAPQEVQAEQVSDQSASPEAASSAAAPEALDGQGAIGATANGTEAKTLDISDVCVVATNAADGLDKVVVEKPSTGETFTLALEPGKQYLFNFEQDEVKSIVQNGDTVTLTLDDGSVIILEGFATATAADVPAALAFKDIFALDNITVAEATPPQDLLDEPKADVAQEVAKVEPAAGDNVDIAQALAQVEPAAGETASAAGDSRGGFGFQSSFNPQGIIGLADVGPINPTSLQYNAPEFEYNGILPENEPDDVPIVTSPVFGVVDETDLNPTDTVGGTLIADFGNDGPGTFSGNGGFDSSITLTSCGEPVTVQQVSGGYIGVSATGETIFTLTINPDGTYLFTLIGVLDHPDATDPNDVIVLDFGFNATDADGDSASGTITINVLDDGPSAGPVATAIDEDGLVNGPVTITSFVPHDYGADGAGSITPNGTVSTQFQMGGPNQPLTSDGQPITITQTANGYIGTLPDGSVVFTMTVDSNGAASFTLNQPVDHPDGMNPDDVIWLQFGVTITDCDGDTVTTYVQIDLHDSGPVAHDDSIAAGGVATGNVTSNDNYGGDGPGFVKSITFNGVVHEIAEGQTITIQGVHGILQISSDGSYIYTATGTGVDTFTYTIQDNDGDMASADLIINAALCGCGDDQPIIVPPGTGVVDETNLNPTDTTGGTIVVDYGDDGPGVVQGDGTFDSSITLTSCGEPVTVASDGNGGYVGTSNGETIFTLTINPDGTYLFTLVGVLDHPDSTNPNDIITLDFGFTATDSDGDSAAGTITINVLDDGPSASESFQVVDEDGLVNGPVSINMGLNYDYGADGEGSVEPNGNVMTLFQMGGQNQTLTSDGQPITIAQTANGYQGTLPDGTVVFTLTLVPYGGIANFTLNLPIDHPDGMNPDDVIWIKFGITVTDCDGDTVTTFITIDLHDSGPVAHDDSLTTNGVITGNVTSNDSYGGDGPGFVKAVTYNGVVHNIAEGQTITIQGQHGVLVISSNGTYTYTATGTGVDNFTYTIQDNDGDMASANLTINANCEPPHDDQPIIVPPALGVVDETDLNPTDTVGGTIQVNYGADGPGTIVGNGQFTSGYALTSDGQPVTVSSNGNGGYVGTTAGGETIFTLTIQPNGTYLFTLLGVLDHANPNNPNDFVTLNFGFTATDADGDSASNSITINVYDDGPTASNDTITTATVATGNVTANDSYGEDGPGFVQSVTYNGVVHNIAEGQTITIVGQYGTLVISSDGSYTYAAFGTGVDLFSYTIHDNDGDLASAVLTINANCNPPTDDQPIIIQPAVGVVDETDLSPTDTTGGTLQADFGNDGPGTFAGNGQFTSSYPLTSDGQPVMIVAGPNGGYIGVVAGGTVGTALTTIFTLTIGPNGQYVFTLYGVLDHANPNNPNDFVTLNFGFTATDADGDTASSSITVQVYDDGPVAYNDTITIATVATGNVTANDSYGEDGPGFVQSVTYNGVVHNIAEGQTITIQGQYGTLVISSTGAYTYAASGTGVDLFSYTIHDNDGDLASAVLTINANCDPHDDTPIIINPAIGVVDETDLNPFDMTGGNLQANFGSDGPGTFASNGQFSSSYPLTSCGEPVTLQINGTSIYGVSNGALIFTLTIQPNGSYLFTLVGVLDHANPDDPNDFVELYFGFTATDSDGDTASSTITIQVYDDGPVAQNDMYNTQQHGDFQISGNVTSNDDYGADGAGYVNSITYNGTTYEIAEGGLMAIHIPVIFQGVEYINTLVMHSDGSFTFYNSVPAGVMSTTFTYTILDCDGDEATATLAFNMIDPLVLDLNGNGMLDLISSEDGVLFDINGDGILDQTGWVGGGDGFLVHDLNGDGLINDVTEMFGNSGQTGFEELGLFDLNGDGVINASDEIWTSLQVWVDTNQDGVSQAGEMFTLDQLGIASINLAYVNGGAVENNGNMVTDVGNFTYADGTTGQIGDVWFGYDAADDGTQLSTYVVNDLLSSAVASDPSSVAGNAASFIQSAVSSVVAADDLTALASDDSLVATAHHVTDLVSDAVSFMVSSVPSDDYLSTAGLYGSDDDLALFQAISAEQSAVTDMVYGLDDASGSVLDISSMLSSADTLQDSIDDFVFSASSGSMPDMSAGCTYEPPVTGQIELHPSDAVPLAAAAFADVALDNYVQDTQAII